MRICLNNFLLFSNSVACGLGHSMVVVDRANVAERLDQVALKSDQLSLELHKLSIIASSSLRIKRRLILCCRLYSSCLFHMLYYVSDYV